MNKLILNKLRNEAGFGWGVAMGLYTHDATEMWVEYDKDGEECWPSRELMEKFAELTVLECAQTIQEYVDHRIPASEYPSRLKKHFE